MVGNISYVTDFQDSSGVVSGHFASPAGVDARRLSVVAPGIDDEAFVLGLGAFYDINDNTRIGLNYRNELRKNSHSSQTIGIGASFGF